MLDNLAMEPPETCELDHGVRACVRACVHAAPGTCVRLSSLLQRGREGEGVQLTGFPSAAAWTAAAQGEGGRVDLRQRITYVVVAAAAP